MSRATSGTESPVLITMLQMLQSDRNFVVIEAAEGLRNSRCFRRRWYIVVHMMMMMNEERTRTRLSDVTLFDGRLWFW
jgi:hypothetical protein